MRQAIVGGAGRPNNEPAASLSCSIKWCSTSSIFLSACSLSFSFLEESSAAHNKAADPVRRHDESVLFAFFSAPFLAYGIPSSQRARARRLRVVASQLCRSRRSAGQTAETQSSMWLEQ